MKTTKTQIQKEALETLKGYKIKAGETVYTILRHHSTSGMYRAIDLYIMRKNQPVRITWSAANAMGRKYDTKHEAMGCSGCGMDMGYDAVYSLSRTLFPNGFKLPKGERGRNGDTSGFDKDGGYALNHRWL